MMEGRVSEKGKGLSPSFLSRRTIDRNGSVIFEGKKARYIFGGVYGFTKRSALTRESGF